MSNGYSTTAPTRADLIAIGTPDHCDGCLDTGTVNWNGGEWPCPHDEPETFVVVTDWSRLDRHGNYREFTRRDTVRAASVVEALDVATDRLPASLDAIIDQHIADGASS